MQKRNEKENSLCEKKSDNEICVKMILKIKLSNLILVDFIVVTSLPYCFRYIRIIQ